MSLSEGHVHITVSLHDLICLKYRPFRVSNASNSDPCPVSTRRAEMQAQLLELGKLSCVLSVWNLIARWHNSTRPQCASFPQPAVTVNLVPLVKSSRYLPMLCQLRQSRINYSLARSPKQSRNTAIQARLIAKKSCSSKTIPNSRTVADLTKGFLQDKPVKMMISKISPRRQSILVLTELEFEVF